ncbi:transposase [Mesorhizobium sp. M1A.F.Ca.IN.020.03.2.1]|uniref:transposase n=2 Tax=Mesorhizobium TaxID=68287 RepID=UPI0032AFC114
MRCPPKRGGRQAMEEDGSETACAACGSQRATPIQPGIEDRLVAACLESGASVSGLALEHGVNANLLWKWTQTAAAKKEPVPSPPLPTPAFIPVRIQSATDRALSRQTSTAAL